MADTTQATHHVTQEGAHDAGASPELAPVMKVTRAKATTSAARPAEMAIQQGGVELVEADSVSVTQGGVTTVNARHVEVRQGGIANAQAEDIKVTMGGVALARADRVHVEMGGLGVAIGREAQVTQGIARSIVAKEVRVDQGLVGTAIAGKVSFERPSPVFLLIAGRTDGPVKAMFDWRGALAFGALFGLVAGMLRRR